MFMYLPQYHFFATKRTGLKGQIRFWGQKKRLKNLEVSFFLFIFAPIILKTLTMNKKPLNHNLLVINILGGGDCLSEG